MAPSLRMPWKTRAMVSFCRLSSCLNSRRSLSPSPCCCCTTMGGCPLRLKSVLRSKVSGTMVPPAQVWGAIIAARPPTSTLGPLGLGEVGDESREGALELVAALEAVPLVALLERPVAVLVVLALVTHAGDCAEWAEADFRGDVVELVVRVVGDGRLGRAASLRR